MADNSVGPMSQKAGLVSQAVPRFPHPSEAAGAPGSGLLGGCWRRGGLLSRVGEHGQGAPLKRSPTSRSEAILVCIMNKGSWGGGAKPQSLSWRAGLAPPCPPAPRAACNYRFIACTAIV